MKNNTAMGSYYFSGIGQAEARFAISNNEIGIALDNYHLSGFSKEKILESKNYKEYNRQHPEKTAFDYFAEVKMGFSKRHHVTPFPPTKKKLYFAESSLDLAVKAVNDALTNSGVAASQIGAWFLSTVSPHEQAPGMAATMKAFLVPFENTTPTFTLTSGCAGFNINLERASEYMNFHPEIEHVVIVHSETMSAFLTNRIKFVPFVTFGDGAAAVVLSRNTTGKEQGLISVVNYHDVGMVDFVGVDKKWNLYMDDSVIKDRAVENIPIAARKVLSETGWNIDDIDLFVPHQTGNAILFPAAEKLGIPKEKVFTEEQLEFGNTSGATVPLSLSMLNKKGKLKPGMKILSAMAGVGGNFGAFTYVVPECNLFCEKSSIKELDGKTALIYGFNQAISKSVARQFLSKGAKVFAFVEKVPEKNIFTDKDFDYIEYNSENIELILEHIAVAKGQIDYLIVAEADTINVNKNNLYIPLQIIKACVKQKIECILAVGSICETTGLPEYHEFVSSLNALHGTLASASGEFLSSGTRTVYYMPGFSTDDFMKTIDDNIRFRLMMQAGQEQLLDVNELANRIVRSVYIPKVENTWSYYENAMIVRCDGYKPEVDI